MHSEIEGAPNPRPGKDVHGNYYDDFFGVKLTVPCCTRDEQEAVKFWGENFAVKFACGIVSKISLQRKTKEPKFEIKFPDKKYQNTFVGYDLDYVLTYCDEVPLKYHTLKAEFIKRTAKKAEADMKQKGKVNASSNADFDDDEDVLVLDMIKKANSSASLKDDKLDGADLKKAEEFSDNASASQSKNKGKRTITDNASSSQKKKKISQTPFAVKTPESDLGSSGEESESGDDEEEEEEIPDLLEDGDGTQDAEAPDISDFDPQLWKLNELPVKNEFTFRGVSGPQHTLPAATALPFEYFCLFIPMFYWDRWAQYTNDKAEIELKAGSKNKWKKTNAAEMKVWVASVIWWTLGVTQSLYCFWRDDYDRNLIKRWFSAFRWLQLKRYFKVSNPSEDETNKGDK
jgi:hypothetical protein